MKNHILGFVIVILASGHFLHAAQPESKRVAAGQEITAESFLAFLDKTRDMIRNNPVQFRGQILANLAKIDDLSGAEPWHKSAKQWAMSARQSFNENLKKAAAEMGVSVENLPQYKFKPHPPAKPRSAQEIKVHMAQMRSDRPLAPTRPAPRHTAEPKVVRAKMVQKDLDHAIEGIKNQVLPSGEFQIYTSFVKQGMSLILSALQSGARPNMHRDKEGHTILAALVKPKELLIEAWPSKYRGEFENSRMVNVKAQKGFGVKHAIRDWGSDIDIHWLAILNTLLLYGADINGRSSDGSTALLRSLRYGYTSYAATLLKMGADEMIKDNNNNTVLHYLFRWPVDLATMLEKLRAKGELQKIINVRNSDGNTPLLNALADWSPEERVDHCWDDRQNYFASAELLLKFGADPFIGDDYGAIEFAKKFMSPDSFERLRGVHEEEYRQAIMGATPMAKEPANLSVEYLVGPKPRPATPEGERKKEKAAPKKTEQPAPTPAQSQRNPLSLEEEGETQIEEVD